MQRVHFNLSLSAQQCERYYAGQVRYVQAEAEDGRIVRFPVTALLPYLTHTGVEGRFCLEFDNNNKFSSLNLISQIS